MKIEEKIFNTIAEKEMHQWGLEGFKNTYPTLFKVIMLSMEQYANQSKQPIAEGETVVVGELQKFIADKIEKFKVPYEAQNQPIINELISIKQKIFSLLEGATLPISVNMPSDEEMKNKIIEEIRLSGKWQHCFINNRLIQEPQFLSDEIKYKLDGIKLFRSQITQSKQVEKKAAQLVLPRDEIETLIELHKHLDICGHNINSNLKEKLREIIQRGDNH